jgi:hypothetical protein
VAHVWWEALVDRGQGRSIRTALQLSRRVADDEPLRRHVFHRLVRGWDECFPTIARANYPGHPYDGIPIPDHGELWGIPTVAVPTKDGITTVWHGLRFGYRLTRKLYLDGAGLTAEYKLVNLAPFDLHFVWAAHALMNWGASDAEIDLGDATPCRLSHDANGVESGETFTWPKHHGENFARLGALEPKRGWKLYTENPIDRPAVIRFPSRGRQISVAFASEDGVAAYWGVWINTGGWAGHKHFAIEPTTGRYDALDRSARDGSAGAACGTGKRLVGHELDAGANFGRVTPVRLRGVFIRG